MFVWKALQWPYNERDGVSNQQHNECLLNRSFRRRSKKTSKLRVTGLVRGIHRWRGNSPHKGSVTWKMFPFYDVIMCIRLVQIIHVKHSQFQWWQPALLSIDPINKMIIVPDVPTLDLEHGEVIASTYTFEHNYSPMLWCQRRYGLVDKEMKFVYVLKAIYGHWFGKECVKMCLLNSTTVRTISNR